jgi:DNA-directed RNA polymerase specialized sigma24 family protein
VSTVPGGAARPGGRAGEEWDDDEAEQAQLVRPYTLTRGRTWHAEGDAFDVIAQISAAEGEQHPDESLAQEPEQQAILELVQRRPLSVAEIAAETDLPLSVVRILLGDLLDAELITVSRLVPAAQLPDARILREVIQGLRAL